jgi:hypothetical protein
MMGTKIRSFSPLPADLSLEELGSVDRRRGCYRESTVLG